MTAFNVKTPDLLDNPVTGYDGLAPEVDAVLMAICQRCNDRGWSVPTVTCFGRLRSEQIQIYAPPIIQDLVSQGIDHTQATAQATARAAGRFSWHCVDTATDEFRAFDLRDWTYAPDERESIIAMVKARWPGAEALDHAVAGNSRHFHFALPADRRPASWR